MQMNLHQTHHTIADFEQILAYLKEQFKNPKTRGLHLFPELYLCGYPLQDLCLQKSFIERYHAHLEKVNDWAQNQWKAEKEVIAYLGGLHYEFDALGLPHKISNVIYEARPGHQLKVLYTKKLLPNYDIFDEEKYFTPGNETVVVEVEGKKLGLLICEDMWVSSMHDTDPVEDLHQHVLDQKIQLDGVINLSGSPYFLGKHQNRVTRASEISQIFGCPFIYVNRVGGEDEVLFDGMSFVVNGQNVVAQARAFQADIKTLELPALHQEQSDTPTKKQKDNTWEGLFRPAINEKGQPLPTINELSDEDCESLLRALSFGLQEYARKTHHKKFTIALSGGVDSALVVTLIKLALEEDQDLEAVYMPGLFSSPLSYELSSELCDRLQIRLRSLPIKFLHSSVKNAYLDAFGESMSGLADENIQSRLRGALIYARSNQKGSMVINTSNKSEIAVGYSTLYGDSVGAISLLGDLYKTEVFRLCRYINQKYGQLIPEQIITRPPSAELRENQEDAQSLPAYERLDPILEGFLSYRLGKDDLKKLGFDATEVDKVHELYQRSEYKRVQFCPIIKVKAKSFGFGYRMPLTKRF